MSELLLLSRTRLTTFLTCQRRFQLRYLAHLAWPEKPLSAAVEKRLALGQQFHRLLERHFLRLPIEAAAIPDATLRAWWQMFQRTPLKFPPGRLLPEITLTVPIGSHLLNGRFDLLIVGETENGASFAHIFDWKTSRPQTDITLRHDWQTRLYLTMLAAGGGAIAESDAETPDMVPATGGFKPEQVALTYWYVSEPEAPRTITYDAAWHAQNWAEIEGVVAQIDARLDGTHTWPLTSDWSQCRTCAYQTYCGRQAAGLPMAIVSEDSDETAVVEYLEPELP